MPKVLDQPAVATYQPHWRSAVGRRLSPWLDPVLGVLAAGLAVSSLLAKDLATIDPRLHEPDTFAVLATATAGLSLAWRRTRPVPSYAAFLLCSLAVSASSHYIGLLSLLFLLSLYSLAAHTRGVAGPVGLAAALAAFGALALADVPDLATTDLVQAAALVVTAWAVGEAIGSRRAEHAERLRAAEQEAAAAREHAASAVIGERLRIARELHDIVAHSMSLIAVQAGVGAHVIDSDTTAARKALEVIADTSRDALDQTRSMLGLLRQPGDPVAGPPTGAAGEVATLVEQMHAAGVAVTLDVVGTADRPGPEVQATMYRIVQESLTNVLKHSASASASVLVTHRPDSVEVDVEDLGDAQGQHESPVRRTSSGHGLIGLQERAELVGGRLVYGPRDGGRFGVNAVLPIGAPT
jgi:signal transduction histidine kinase